MSVWRRMRDHGMTWSCNGEYIHDWLPATYTDIFPLWCRLGPRRAGKGLRTSVTRQSKKEDRRNGSGARLGNRGHQKDTTFATCAHTHNHLEDILAKCAALTSERRKTDQRSRSLGRVSRSSPRFARNARRLLEAAPKPLRWWRMTCASAADHEGRRHRTRDQSRGGANGSSLRRPEALHRAASFPPDAREHKHAHKTRQARSLQRERGHRVEATISLEETSGKRRSDISAHSFAL